MILQNVRYLAVHLFWMSMCERERCENMVKLLVTVLCRATVFNLSKGSDGRSVDEGWVVEVEQKDRQKKSGKSRLKTKRSYLPLSYQQNNTKMGWWWLWIEKLMKFIRSIRHDFPVSDLRDTWSESFTIMTGCLWAMLPSFTFISKRFLNLIEAVPLLVILIA